jgi:hypothetical protein
MRLLPASIQAMTQQNMVGASAASDPITTPSSMLRAYQLTRDISSENLNTMYGAGMGSVQGMTVGYGERTRAAHGMGVGELSEFTQSLITNTVETANRIAESILTPANRNVGPYTSGINNPPADLEFLDSVSSIDHNGGGP